MENEFPLRIKQGLLVLIISISTAVYFQKKLDKRYKNYTEITIKDSLNFTVQDLGLIRGGFTFNDKYIFCKFNDNINNYNLISDLEVPFLLFKKSKNDTVFFIKENKKYFLTINKAYYKDPTDTIKNFGDMSLRDLYESWKQNKKK